MGTSLEQQRQRINELENTLKTNRLNTDEAKNLKKILNSLRAEIATKDSIISNLKVQIARKDADITRLNTEVSNLNELNEQQEEILNVQDGILNGAYVCIGTDKELQSRGLLTKGSIFKKKKLNLSDINTENFEKIDIRTKTKFNIAAKKIKILTPVIEGTYTITNESGSSVLEITNPNKFWSMSNYLIIQKSR